MTTISLISEVLPMAVGGAIEEVRIASAQWNIFIGVRVFVDHSKMIPSTEPDANRLAVCVYVCEDYACVCVNTV